MAGKQAKILTDSQYSLLITFLSTLRHPRRNRVIALLSIKAGLRAGEISKLTWEMVLDPTESIAPAIELRDHAAKKQSGRLIPIHRDLRAALEEWKEQTDSRAYGNRRNRSLHKGSWASQTSCRYK